MRYELESFGVDCKGMLVGICPRDKCPLNVVLGRDDTNFFMAWNGQVAHELSENDHGDSKPCMNHGYGTHCAADHLDLWREPNGRSDTYTRVYWENGDRLGDRLDLTG